MPFSRVGYWALVLRWLRQGLRCVAVLLVSCSLIFTGRLFWVDNSWAVIPDGDPATSFDSSLLLELLAGEIDCDDLDPDGDGQIPLTGGKLVKGNGDQDDNRSEPWRIVYRPGATVAPSYSPAPIKAWSNRPLKSYLDFGHLKVFPDASASLITIEKFNYYGKKAAALYPRGRLFVFYHDPTGAGGIRLAAGLTKTKIYDE